MSRHTITVNVVFDEGYEEEEYDGALEDYMEAIVNLIRFPYSDDFPAQTDARVTEIYAEET